MITPRLLELKSTPQSLESKQHPAIVALERFYQSKTLIETVKLFINKDAKVELDFPSRMMRLLTEDFKTLSEWAYVPLGSSANSL